MTGPTIDRKGNNVHVLTADGILTLDWPCLRVVVGLVMHSGRTVDEVRTRLTEAGMPGIDDYMPTALHLAEHHIDLDKE